MTLMTSKPLVATLVIGSIVSASLGSAHAQAAPQPAPAPPPAAAPQGPPPPPYQQQYPAQYPPRYAPPEQYPPPPPPASALAPNGEYVAPLSQTSQPTYVPQSVALSGPRIIRDWEEGQPIPYGYHHELRIRKGRVIAGSVVFGVLYLISAYSAAIGEDVADGGQNKAGWLFLPVLGPFLEWSQTDSWTLRYMLALDGIAQGVGLTLLITGLLNPQHVLVRNDLASMTVVPMKIGMDGSGMGLVGRF
jgi:hypothetical protein